MDRAVELSAEGALMGWVWLVLLMVATFGALIVLKVDRLLWTMVAAALTLGAAGYAFQGRPDLAGHDAVTRTTPPADDGEMEDLRDRMLGRFTGQAAYLTAADAMARSGDNRAAVQVLLGGIRKAPDSMMLWTELGSALVAHDGNQISPPALFAFQHAMRLGPDHPAPVFFLGLAYVRTGEMAKARLCWARALALTPRSISYYQDIAVRLALLDQFIAMQAAERP